MRLLRGVPWPAVLLEKTEIVKSSVVKTTILCLIPPSVTFAPQERGHFFQSFHTLELCPGQIVQVSCGTVQVITSSWQNY